MKKLIQKIPFNQPFISGLEQELVSDAISKGDLTGDGVYSKQSIHLLQEITGAKSVLLTPSATHGLEMAALAINIDEGDEVVMSSFTFVSCGNAFVLRGAKIVFVDIRPDTMNIDEQKIEAAISERTKAIVVMHYGGVACEMDTIMALAAKYSLFVIEDAAHCIDAYYKEKHLGTIGHFGVLSFHSTKNIHCGEGGALLVNAPSFVERLEIIREKGTNRQQLLDGKVDKYSWVDIGSSYLMSELNAAYLLGQLRRLHLVSASRRDIWQKYYHYLQSNKALELPVVPVSCRSNGHVFFIKLKDKPERDELIDYLNENSIKAVFHYIPLHSSVAGKKYGFFYGKDQFTTRDSERLLRLPMYYGFEEVAQVCEKINQFFDED